MTNENPEFGTIEDYYADSENCLYEIRLAREIFGSTESTYNDWKGMERALAFMYLYCPEDLTNIVNAALNECFSRKLMMIQQGTFPQEAAT